MPPLRRTLFAALSTLIAGPTLAEQVNVYSYRQPELIQPLFDQFTSETGIAVNVAFLQKGLVEKLKAEANEQGRSLNNLIERKLLAA